MPFNTTPAVGIPGFNYHRVDVGGTVIHCATAGSGPPVLLLHGYPQTHLMWRHIAPELTSTHTVVVTDLRGYGDSDKPTPASDNATYAKRAMAEDQVKVMQHFGFDRFDVVGHDRGARVAHRMALDRPDIVTRVALLDIVPTRHVLAHADRAMATAYFHWFLCATGGGIPEHLIGGDPDFWIRAMIERLLANGASIEPPIMAEYIRCFTESAIAATCSDYRAGATIDLEHDDTSARAGDRIQVPTLVLWGEKSFVGTGYQPLLVWPDYAADVRGRALPAGHFLPEEVPDMVLVELRALLGDAERMPALEELKGGELRTETATR